MTICAVFGCKSSDQPRYKKPDVKFHSFPSDPMLFQIWRQACRVQSLPKRPFICSLHFAADALKLNIHEVIGEPTPKNARLLKHNAVPTLHLWKSKSNEPTPKSIRAQRRANRKLAYEMLNATRDNSPVPTKHPKLRNIETPKIWKPCVAEAHPAETHNLTYSDERGAQVEFLDMSNDLLVEVEREEELEMFLESDVGVVDVAAGEVDVATLEDLCRVCAQSAPQHVAVFSEEGSQLQLQHKIELCLPITVAEEDKLPLKVCSQCIPRLQASYELATLCLKSDHILNDLLHEEQQLEYPSVYAVQCVETCMEEVEELNVASPCSASSNITCETSKPPNIFNAILLPSSLKTESEPQIKTSIASSNHKTHKSSLQKTLDVFICSLCYKAFYTEKDKVNHMKEGHVFMCLNCNFKIKGLDRSVLDDHNKICQNAKVLNALENTPGPSEIVSQQETEVLSREVVESPKSKQKSKPPSNNNKPSKFEVRCNKCYVHFASYLDLNSHECVPGIECTICDVYCESMHIYKSHLKVIHSVIPCKSRQFCLQYFDTEEAANIHYKSTHRKKARQTCNICDKTFSKPELLREHIEYIHEKQENKYKCQLCDKSYRYYPKLKQHVLQKHEGKKIFKCPNCTNRFLTSPEMKQHVIQSHPQKLHTCDDCKASFVYKIELRYHIENIHVHGCTYVCNTCDYTSNLLNPIKLHCKTHSSSEAGPKFHKISNFQCKICLSYYKNRHYLYLHFKRVHKLTHAQYKDLAERAGGLVPQVPK